MTKRPFTVQAAAALEGAEGLAFLAFGVYTGVQTASGAAVDPVSAIGVTVLALAGGIGMLACARGVLRAEPWSRAPTVLTQLFALPIAWSLWQSGQPAVGIPLGLVAVLALITVLAPPSNTWLLEDHDEEDDGDGGEKDAHDERSAHAKDTKAKVPGKPGEAAPAEPRSLGQRLMARLKVDDTRN